jgi:RsiW-degrading membrane proteinase PrsW (M82 family)
VNYIENTYICLAAPMLIAILSLRKEGRRSLIFVLSGMTACLFSAYVSAFFAGVMGLELTVASYEVSPAVEEIMKALPVLFYLLVYEPDKRSAVACTLMLAVGFATFENICFLTSYGTSNLLRLLIRGFSTGAMHVACGAVTAVVLRGMWNSLLFRTIATLGVLCLSITCHGIYNILVNQDGIPAMIGYLLPLLLGAGAVFARKKIYGPAANPTP